MYSELHTASVLWVCRLSGDYRIFFHHKFRSAFLLTIHIISVLIFSAYEVFDERPGFDCASWKYGVQYPHSLPDRSVHNMIC